MIKISRTSLIVLSLFFFFVSLGSLSSLSEEDPQDIIFPAPTPTPLVSPSPFQVEAMQNINDIPFRDNPDLYQSEDPVTLVYIYITVRKGNQAENTDYTWAEVNSFNKWINGSRSANDIVGEAEVIVQFGDETGPLPDELGYGVSIPNGTIQIRGASSSSTKHQKSYKIELKKGAGKWRGQSTFALNKHIYEISRIRNKLNFDLMEQIPNLVSLRTQFVRLFVKDESITPPSDKFVDYGLFTQVEQVNRAFLENHLLDRNAQLYKATSFEFDRYEDQIRLIDDPLYNEAEFSHRLEIKGNTNHSKLIRMLDDITDYDIPIEQSFKKYFDADNYFTWMAFNILVGNVDTQNQNFFLYSPQNSEKWYFLPWDYDDSFFRQRRLEAGEYPYLGWEEGVTNYWGGILHNRILRSEEYRIILDNKIEELRLILTAKRIQGLLDTYRPIVEPIIFSRPDIDHLPTTKAEFENAYRLIPTEVEYNYNLYLESLEKPMPFYLGTPVISGEKLLFMWDESYCFEPQNITYHFSISRDLHFQNTIFEKAIVNVTSIEAPLLEPGDYYWRVIATNEKGMTQSAFDAYTDTEGYSYDSVKKFIVVSDEEVIEPEN